VIVFRPIDAWAGADTAHRLHSPFTAGWSDTIRLLTVETRALAPFGQPTPPVVIQIDVPPALIRQDGFLRSGARVGSPRVVVSLTTAHGPLRYQCDRFDTQPSRPAWQANVRAIALGLQALRTVDRYGIAGSGEQYRGWAAIDAAPDDDLTLLARLAGVDGNDSPAEAWVRETYRRAALTHHPDVGGDPATFRALTEARDRILRRIT